MSYAIHLAEYRAQTKAIKAITNGLAVAVKTGKFTLGTHVSGALSELIKAKEKLELAGYTAKVVHDQLLQVNKCKPETGQEQA